MTLAHNLSLVLRSIEVHGSTLIQVHCRAMAARAGLDRSTLQILAMGQSTV